MTKKLTKKDFEDYIQKTVGTEYTLLGEYKNCSTGVLIRHNSCGNVYKVSFSKFKAGQRCPKERYLRASKSSRRSDEEYSTYFENTYGKDYIKMSKYINNTTKIDVLHKPCGNLWKVTPASLSKGHRCFYCYGSQKKTDEQYTKEFNKKHSEHYIKLSKYNGMNSPIKVLHKKCGKVWETLPIRIDKGARCFYCYGSAKRSDTQFKKEVEDTIGKDYTFLEPYIGNNVKIACKCNTCGYIWKIAPATFLNKGVRCPECKNNYKGESLIKGYLSNKGIDYESQKRFNDLKDKLPLSYDVYSKELNCLFEYQGIQHYKPTSFNKNKYKDDEEYIDIKFKKQKYHDKLKADYAETKDIKLIIVPYTINSVNKMKNFLDNKLL